MCHKKERHVYTVSKIMYKGCVVCIFYVICFYSVYNSPGNSTSLSCPEHAVSNCQACFYSPTPLSYDEQRATSCAQNCVDSSGEYDPQCLKNWGTCMQKLFTPDYRSVS